MAHIFELQRGDAHLEKLIEEKFLPSPLLHDFVCLCAEELLNEEQRNVRPFTQKLRKMIAAKRAWLEGKCSVDELYDCITDIRSPQDFLASEGFQLLGQVAQGLGRFFRSASSDFGLRSFQEIATPSTEAILDHTAKELVLAAADPDLSFAFLQVYGRFVDYKVYQNTSHQIGQFLRDPALWLSHFQQGFRIEEWVELIREELQTSDPEQSENWRPTIYTQARKEFQQKLAEYLKALSQQRRGILTLFGQRSLLLGQELKRWQGYMEDAIFE